VSKDSGSAQPPDGDVEEPVLPQVSSDERAEGWGEDPRDGRRDDDWYLSERPPHHGD
jgi:hypothetical protein